MQAAIFVSLNGFRTNCAMHAAGRKIFHGTNKKIVAFYCSEDANLFPMEILDGRD
jgi:hypothetical protein